MTLDGVMQAPGGSQEDTTNDFPYGGWSVKYWDDVIEKEMSIQMSGDFNLLLGRRTYDGFAANWPLIDPKSIINKVTKYVVTSKPVPSETDIWKGTIKISGNIIDEIKKLKNECGPDLHVHGSGRLVQTLLKNDLIDEFWLKIYPIVLGTGNHLFESGLVPITFKTKEVKLTPSGIIMVKYVKSGDYIKSE
jgi:dihydrofolate reductase